MVEAVTNWVDENAKNNPDEPETVIFSVADHECGGLTLGEQRQEDEEGFYGWFPDVLFNATHSTEYLAGQVLDYIEEEEPSDEELTSYIKDEVVVKGLGIQDVQDDEVARAVELAKIEDGEIPLTVWLSSIVNWRGHIGWSTTGHSGVDVALYYHEAIPSNKKGKKYEQYQQRRKSVIGSHENTFIGTWTADFLGLDLAGVTKRLNNGSDYSWYSNWGDKLNEFTEKLEHYHGGLARVIPPLPAGLEKRELAHSHADNVPLLRRMHGKSASLAERSHSHQKRDEL